MENYCLINAIFLEEDAGTDGAVLEKPNYNFMNEKNYHLKGSPILLSLIFTDQNNAYFFL